MVVYSTVFFLFFSSSHNTVSKRKLYFTTVGRRKAFVLCVICHLFIIFRVCVSCVVFSSSSILFWLFCLRVCFCWREFPFMGHIVLLYLNLFPNTYILCSCSDPAPKRKRRGVVVVVVVVLLLIVFDPPHTKNADCV